MICPRCGTPTQSHAGYTTARQHVAGQSHEQELDHEYRWHWCSTCKRMVGEQCTDVRGNWLPEEVFK